MVRAPGLDLAVDPGVDRVEVGRARSPVRHVDAATDAGPVHSPPFTRAPRSPGQTETEGGAEREVRRGLDLQRPERRDGVRPCPHDADSGHQRGQSLLRGREGPDRLGADADDRLDRQPAQVHREPARVPAVGLGGGVRRPDAAQGPDDRADPGALVVRRAEQHQVALLDARLARAGSAPSRCRGRARPSRSRSPLVTRRRRTSRCRRSGNAAALAAAAAMDARLTSSPSSGTSRRSRFG